MALRTSHLPCFLGVVADPQYADKANMAVIHHKTGPNSKHLLSSIGPPAHAENGSMEGRTQRYREVPAKLTAAVQHWSKHQPPLSRVLTLGDIVDGRPTQEASLKDLETLAVIFDQLAASVPVSHVVGNHDLVVPRSTYIGRLGLPDSYYIVQLCPGWRLIVLDTTDLGPRSGYPEDSHQMQETVEFQASHPIEEFDNMEPWNGGVASQQLRWLTEQLRAAETAGERLVLAGHHPIGQGSARDSHRAWNWRELQVLLTSSPAVALVFAGHDHVGGYSQIEHVHFVTLEAMLEASTDSNAYGVVALHEQHIDIKGTGAVTSRHLPLKPWQPSTASD